MKLLYSLLTLLLTVPCFADNYWNIPDPQTRIMAGFKLLGLLLLMFLLFAIPCLVIIAVCCGAGKLFEKCGGKAKHFAEACAALVGLYALGARSMKRRK